jgi:hypothetical protein
MQLKLKGLFKCLTGILTPPPRPEGLEFLIVNQLPYEIEKSESDVSEVIILLRHPAEKKGAKKLSEFALCWAL